MSAEVSLLHDGSNIASTIVKKQFVAIYLSVISSHSMQKSVIHGCDKYMYSDLSAETGVMHQCLQLPYRAICEVSAAWR